MPGSHQLAEDALHSGAPAASTETMQRMSTDMRTPELLTAYETCDRKGFWSRDWQPKRMHATRMLYEAIRAGVTEAERKDFGDVAGERTMELAADPGMEMPSSRHLHDSVVHHAALADTLTSAIRGSTAEPWGIPPPVKLRGAPWASGAFLGPSGSMLRRIVLVSSWNDERHYSEIRSWYGLGEVAAYGLPMSMVVCVLGQHRDGKRSGPWTKGFLHPQNHKLRFRKKARLSSEVFSEKWEQVWREDRGEIATREWLQAMLDDDILRDVCFPVEIPLPSALELERIRDMAARKLDRVLKLKELPEKSLSVCDRPACPFKGCCWSQPEYPPSERAGYASVQFPVHIGK